MTDVRSSPHERAAEAFARRVRDHYGDVVDTLALFGSAARGEARGPDSDVDLLIVVRDDAPEVVEDDIRDLAYDVELAYEVPFSLVIKTESEYERQRDRPFLRAVENDARVLYG